MKRTNWLGLALAAALLGAMTPAAALAQASAPGRFGTKDWDPQAQQNRQPQWDQQTQDQRSWNSGRADFDGRWVAQDRNDPRFGGNSGNGGGYGNGDFGNGGFRGGAGSTAMLPDFLRIDQQRQLVRITDRGNHVIQVIAIDRGFRSNQGRATLLSGVLRGSQLVAHGTDARGRSMTQTMLLRDRGRTLVVRTEVERGRSGRTFQTEKVYQRA